MTDVNYISDAYKSILNAYTAPYATTEEEEILEAQKQKWWDEFCRIQVALYRKAYPEDSSLSDEAIINSSINAHIDYYAALFVDFIKDKYSLGALAAATSSSPAEEAKRKIMYAVFDSVSILLGTLQDTITTLGPIMELNLQWQRAYANRAAQAVSHTGVASIAVLPANATGTSYDLDRATLGFGNISIAQFTEYMATVTGSKNVFQMPILDSSGKQLTTTNTFNAVQWFGGSNNIYYTSGGYQNNFYNNFYLEFDPINKQIVLKIASSCSWDPWNPGPTGPKKYTWTSTVTTQSVTSPSGAAPTAADWKTAIDNLYKQFTTSSKFSLTADGTSTPAGQVNITYNPASKSFDFKVYNQMPYAQFLWESGSDDLWYVSSINFPSLYFPPLRPSEIAHPISDISNLHQDANGAWYYGINPYNGQNSGIRFYCANTTAFHGTPGILTPDITPSTADSTTSSKLQEQRAAANTRLQQYTTLLAARQQALHDRIQGLQATMNQAQEIYNQQTTLLSNIIQNLQTLVSTICR